MDNWKKLDLKQKSKNSQTNTEQSTTKDASKLISGLTGLRKYLFYPNFFPFRNMRALSSRSKDGERCFYLTTLIRSDQQIHTFFILYANPNHYFAIWCLRRHHLSSRKKQQKKTEYCHARRSHVMWCHDDVSKQGK